MDRRQPSGLAKEPVKVSWLYQSFNWVFGILFVGVLVLIVFFNTNSFFEYAWWRLLIAAAAGILLAFVVSRLFSLLPHISVRTEVIVVIALFVVYAAAQGYLGWALEVQTSTDWDFGVVYTHAEKWVLNRTMPTNDYFLSFSVNQGLYVLYCAFFSVLHLFGISNFHLPMLIVNILCINGALLLMYFCARRLFDARKALFLLVAAFFTLPFLLYVPIYYTDTLTLPIPVGMVFLWLKARTSWRNGNMGGAWGRFIAIAALAGVGALLKITVLIVLIAIVIDLLIVLRGAKRLLMGLAGAALCAALAVGGSFGMRVLPMLPQYDYSNGIPFTHWIMMGLHGDGGYYDSDYKATLAVEGKDARYWFTVDEIKARLTEMGPAGIAQHLGRKLSFTYGDGLYTAALKLSRQPLRQGFLHEFVAYGGNRLGVISYYAFGVQAAILAWMVVAAIKSFFRRNNAMAFMRVAIFGLTLFLLIWETRTRYMLNYLPLFLLCGLEAVPAPRLMLQKVRAKRVVEAAYEQDTTPCTEFWLK